MHVHTQKTVDTICELFGSLQGLLDEAAKRDTVAELAREKGLRPARLRDWVNFAKRNPGARATDNNGEVVQYTEVVREVDPPELLKRDRKIKSLEEEKKELRGLLKLSEREVEEAWELVGLKQEIDERKKVAYKVEPSKKSSESVAVGVASDWHIGESISHEDVPHYPNEYNKDVAVQRICRFFSNFDYLINKERACSSISTVVLALLGDLINGHLRDEDLETNDLHPNAQVSLALDLCVSGIRHLLRSKDTKKLIVPCSVGNHSRETRFVHAATEVQNSKEWLLYDRIRAEFASDDRVQVLLPTAYHTWLDIYGFPIRFHHGHEIKYNGGVGGLSIPLIKAIYRWNKVRPAHLDIMGHYHTLQHGPDFMVNGSACGYNAYAMRKGFNPEPPQQGFLLVNKTHGRTVTAPIFLDS